MAKISFACPHCGKKLGVPMAMAGKKGKCPNCQGVVEVPVGPVPAGEVAEPGPQKPVPAGAGTANEESMPDSGGEEPEGRPEPTPGSVSVPPNLFGSDVYDYTFILPTDGWQRYGRAEEEQTGADVLLEHPDMGGIKIVVSEWRLPPNELFESAEEQYRSEVNEFRLLDSRQAKVAGRDAMYFEYMGIADEEEGLLTFGVYCFVEEDQCFQVMAISAPERFGRLMEDVTAAMQSFSFDDQMVYLYALKRTQEDILARKQTLRWAVKRGIYVAAVLAGGGFLGTRGVVQFFGPVGDIVVCVMVLILGIPLFTAWALAFRKRVSHVNFAQSGCFELGCLLTVVLPVMAPFDAVGFLLRLKTLERRYEEVAGSS